MSGLIPYVVLAVVILGFFAVCYAVFNKSESDNETNLEKDVSHKDVREQNVYEEETIHVTQKQPHDDVDVYAVEDEIITEQTLEIPVVDSSTEDTIALGESPDMMSATSQFLMLMKSMNIWVI